MSDSSNPTGAISWIDLTVDDAEAVRQFYEAVVGWTNTPVDMGDYSDYCMSPPQSGQPVAGICHARGQNANLPAQWLIYITVDDLRQSMDRCKSLGGKVLREPTSAGGGRYAIIQDPAGAIAALYEAESDE